MSNVVRLSFVTVLTVAGFGFAVAAASTAERPNILFIMSDDHAAHALSAYGSKINETPQLDRLAKEGMRFDRCFATNSICTPSRATILTGKYSHKNGVPVFNKFDGAQPTVAKMLQAAGYHTGMVGKWHLGSDPTGFDSWAILQGQGPYNNPVMLTNDGKKPMQGYTTDIITDLAIDFLRKKPAEKPFFLMCHHKAPHRNWVPDAKHKEQFAGKTIPEPATLFDDYATRTDAIRECKQKILGDLAPNDTKGPPPPDLKGEALARWKYQRYMQDYLACVQAVDDNVGRLLDYLDQSGLAKNTLVIYTSDQGFFLGDHGLYDKRFMYEESIKMPFLVRWPGVIKPGSTQAALATNVDFAETFLEAAGLPIPADMQGHSLVPLFKGEVPSAWRKSWYYRYYHDPGDHNTRAHYGVRTETHKLIYFWKKDQWEMYDLVKDPGELKNLYNDPAQAETVKELKAELARLKKEVQDNDEFAGEQPKNGVGAKAKKGNQVAGEPGEGNAESSGAP